MANRCLLYYITDRTAFPGDERTRRRHVLDKIEEAAACGVDYIQLREKDLTAREMQSLAFEATSIVHRLRNENQSLRTALLINSRTDVALASRADGVHLRSEDVSLEDVRDAWKLCSDTCECLPRVPLVGVSCHSPAEVSKAAANRATFTVFAPVYEKKGSLPTGLEILNEACRANIPVLALGGVTIQNAAACLQTGAAGIAGIRLFQNDDIATVVHALRSIAAECDQNERPRRVRRRG
jgi:thiamine-phosphate pyrophosphorylase